MAHSEGDTKHPLKYRPHHGQLVKSSRAGAKTPTQAPGEAALEETTVPEMKELRLHAGPPPLRTAMSLPALSAGHRSSELQAGHSGYSLSAPATAPKRPSWHLPGPPAAPERLPGSLWEASESAIITD